jgi:hypothetical protein
MSIVAILLAGVTLASATPTSLSVCPLSTSACKKVAWLTKLINNSSSLRGLRSLPMAFVEPITAQLAVLVADLGAAAHNSAGVAVTPITAAAVVSRITEIVESRLL